MAIQVHTIVSAPFAENSYLLWQPGQPEGVVIDPGFDPDSILAFVDAEQLTLTQILLTHGHVDHIAGVDAMKSRFPEARIVIGQGDAHMLTDANANLSSGFGVLVLSPPADQLVHQGDLIEALGRQWEVHEIPGHSPGHVVYRLLGDEEPWVFGGDVLFRGSIGRSDFPGGSLEQLLDGIRTKLWPLPERTVIYPGHGPVTTVGHEKQTNPFLQ